MADKKALKGLRGIRVFPVVDNTETAYTTGAKLALVAAQNLTKEVSKSDYTVYGDDGIYDTGADYQYEDLTVTVAELPLEIESKLSGGTYDETDKTYTFKNIDDAPEYALGYAALMSNKQYRMFKHYAVKLMSVKVDHATKGGSNEIAAYQLTFRNTQRNADGAVRITKDGEDGTYAWLDTIDQIPEP